MSKLFRAEIQSKKILVVFVTAVLVFLIGAFVQFKKTEKAGNNDFSVYYKTSVRLADSNWDNIYTRKDGPFPFRYIPYSLVSFTWPDHFTESEARKVWVVVQAFAFGIAFYFLYQSLVIVNSQWPLLAASLSSLMTFRYYMDSYFSGQTAGLMFLSFSLGLYFFLKKQTVRDGVSISFAASLKIFPGILLIHGLIKAEGTSRKIRFLLSGILLFIFLNLIFLAWLYYHNAVHQFSMLWKNWIDICLADSEYFDGSTPKSQSLRAFMLRVYGKNEKVEFYWKITTLLGISSLIIYWIKAKTKSLYEEGFSYCMGILAFLFFMPESLPHQLMAVAIPLAFLIGHPNVKTKMSYKIMLTAFAAIITFASTDFIGRWPSDKLQQWSIPFIIITFMACLFFQKDHVVKT
ncbi:MAG: DUF2029 domain-containing protein [Rhizobacter sp.]|nr:DUF2029 domain-containing protein [Bacteriovorax sp.]